MWHQVDHLGAAGGLAGTAVWVAATPIVGHSLLPGLSTALILVAGGTGQLGRKLLELIEPRDQIRVLTRASDAVAGVAALADPVNLNYDSTTTTFNGQTILLNPVMRVSKANSCQPAQQVQ